MKWDKGSLGIINIDKGSNLFLASLQNFAYKYDAVGNIIKIKDNDEVLNFSYDELNRLTSVGGACNENYSYSSPVTGNLSNKSDVGGYSYSQTQPHAVTGAGTNSYTYDRNGNMKTRTVAEKLWTYSYNAEGKITAVRKDGQLISEYGYDGDGNRVWAKDYEGYQASYPGTTLYVGNYYELVSDGRPPEQGTASVCTGAHCTYMPFMYKAPKGISYYYADGQRIAMRSNNTVSWLYGDQLGSVSAVAKADGTLISRNLYYPWGSERLTQGTSPTDYGYTGQMREGDIYYYNARWYDPMIGRFMQADTIVPLEVQGIQAFDRYAYVNNNPVNGTDLTGHSCSGPGCMPVYPVSTPPPQTRPLDVSPASTPPPPSDVMIYPIVAPRPPFFRVPPPIFTPGQNQPPPPQIEGIPDEWVWKDLDCGLSGYMNKADPGALWMPDRGYSTRFEGKAPHWDRFPDPCNDDHHDRFPSQPGWGRRGQRQEEGVYNPQTGEYESRSSWITQNAWGIARKIGVGVGTGYAIYFGVKVILSIAFPPLAPVMLIPQ